MQQLSLPTKTIRNDFTIAYLSAALLMALNLVVPIELRALAERFFPYVLEDMTLYLPYIYIPVSFINFPLAALILKSYVPSSPIHKSKMSAKRLFVLFTVTYFIAFAGNIIGSLVSIPFGNHVVYGFVLSISQSNVWVRIALLCALVPLAEEFFFRKLIIDRLNRYGMWVAVLASALMFALYHGTVNQLFYTFGIGMVFGYIYIKSGNIWYTWILHFIINFLSTVIVPAVTGGMFASEYPLSSFAALFIFVQAIFCLIIFGLVNLVLYRKKISFAPRVKMLPQKGWAAPVFVNWGMAAALCLYAVNLMYSLSR